VIPLARLITDDFLEGKIGRVDVIYSRFVTTLTQRPEIDRSCRSNRRRTPKGSPATSSSSSRMPPPS
jgi:F0F1-type ATP synthase gamma subunit